MPHTRLLSPFWLAIGLLFGGLSLGQAQGISPAAQSTELSQSAKPSPAPAVPDRSSAYYHAALAGNYEDMAATYGRQEYVTRAIEEYKLALNADPASAELTNALAGLYFRAGRVREAIVTTQDLLKREPNNLDAHKLLGRIYLRSLGEGQNGAGDAGPANDMLNLAIAEFEKIVALEPKNVEDRMLLGQLYTAKHDTKKAEESFRAAQKIEPDSEDVILNLARLAAESGDLNRAASTLEAVPVGNRSPRVEFMLGAIYDQLKEPKKAVAAYQRSIDMEPDNVDAQRALAQALLADNQLDEALKQFQAVAQANPDDSATLIRIAEIERRQGKFDAALDTIRKAKAKDADPLEVAYQEGLLLDVLGRYDEAVAVYEKAVDLTAHANGAYTEQEKNNRSIFLDRLAAVYHEENKTAQAIATYQKLIELGGDFAKGGYRGQVDTYRDALQFDQAVDVSRKAVEAYPKDKDMRLMLGWELSNAGKFDEAIDNDNALLDHSPADRDIYLQNAQIYARQHHWKDSEDSLAKAEPLATKKEDRANLLYQKGYIAELQKHYDQAEQLFRQVLEIDPDNATTLNNLGYMLADKNMKLTEALKFARKAVELDPTNGAFLDSLGWAYFKLGQYELAEDNLRRAVERAATDPTVHDHLGDLYEKTGRIRLAASQWEMSLAGYAKSAAADVEPGDVAKVQKKLEGARIRLAKQDSIDGVIKP